jgi:hypothetical protein
MIPFISLKEPTATLTNKVNYSSFKQIMFHHNHVVAISYCFLHIWTIDSNAKEFLHSQLSNKLSNAANFSDGCLHPTNGNILITGGNCYENNVRKGEIIFWNISTLSEMKKVRDSTLDLVDEVKIDPKGEMLIVTDSNGIIIVYRVITTMINIDLELLKRIDVFQCEYGFVHMLIVSSSTASSEQHLSIICQCVDQNEIVLFDATSGTISSRFDFTTIESIKGTEFRNISYNENFGLIGSTENKKLILIDISGSEWKEIHHISTTELIGDIKTCDTLVPMVLGTAYVCSIYIWSIPQFTPITQVQSSSGCGNLFVHPSGLIFATFAIENTRIQIWCDDIVSSLQEFLLNDENEQ